MLHAFHCSISSFWIWDRWIVPLAPVSCVDKFAFGPLDIVWLKYSINIHKHKWVGFIVAAWTQCKCQHCYPASWKCMSVFCVHGGCIVVRRLEFSLFSNLYLKWPFVVWISYHISPPIFDWRKRSRSSLFHVLKRGQLTQLIPCWFGMKYATQFPDSWIHWCGEIIEMEISIANFWPLECILCLPG